MLTIRRDPFLFFIYLFIEGLSAPAFCSTINNHKVLMAKALGPVLNHKYVLVSFH